MSDPTKMGVPKASLDPVWEEPPDMLLGGRGKGVWIRRLTQLIQRPGEWARFGPFEGNNVSHLSNGHVKIPLPDHTWEFTSRRVQGEGSYIYARYVGPPNGEAK